MRKSSQHVKEWYSFLFCDKSEIGLPYKNGLGEYVNSSESKPFHKKKKYYVNLNGAAFVCFRSTVHNGAQHSCVRSPLLRGLWELPTLGLPRCLEHSHRQNFPRRNLQKNCTRMYSKEWVSSETLKARKPVMASSLFKLSRAENSSKLCKSLWEWRTKIKLCAYLDELEEELEAERRTVVAWLELGSLENAGRAVDWAWLWGRVPSSDTKGWSCW